MNTFASVVGETTGNLMIQNRDNYLQYTEEDFQFPDNTKFESLGTTTQQIHFSENYPFSFENLYPMAHTLLLNESEFPLPIEDNQIEMSILKTPYIQGLLPEIEDKENFEKQKDYFSKKGYMEIAEPFLINADDSIPDSIDDDEIISQFVEIDRCKNPGKIIMLNFENVKIKPVVQPRFYERIKKFEKLEILSLINTGITEMPDCIFPKIRICSVTNNAIENPETLINFAQRHSTLAILDYRRNPVAADENTRIELTATCVNLMYLNGHEISIKDRVVALESFDVGARTSHIDKLHFIYQIKNIPEINYLGSWNPLMICHLSLPSCGLRSICLHEFKNLQSLNLADNEISTLTDSGIVNCQFLISADFSKNNFTKFENIEPIKLCMNLLHVWFTLNPLTGYRSYLIYKCRRLAGTCAMNGLATIDNIPVTLNELVDSMVNVHPSKYHSLKNELIMNGNIMQRVGNRLLFDDPDVLSKLTSFTAVKRNLAYFDASNFVNITHLVLRGNVFEKVIGLNHCRKLRLLDMSHNPNLKIELMADDIKKCKDLQFLMVAEDCWDPQYDNVINFEELYLKKSNKKSIRNPRFRQQIINMFVKDLPRLSSIDRARITVPERMAAIKDLGMPEVAQEVYACHVAMLQASKPADWLSLSVADVIPGNQYKQEEIVKLHRLTNCNLKSTNFLNFSNFTKLVEIDLSYNKLTTLTTLGFENLQNLKMIDVSFNDINETPEAIGMYIDRIPNLEMISLRSNPCGKTESKKVKMLQQIKRLTKTTDSLRVIDIEILPPEIIKHHNVDKKRQDLVYYMFELAMKIRLPFNFQAEKIIEIDFSNCGLKYCDISKFVSLKRLILKNNKLSGHENMIGFQGNELLEILDVRDNRIENIIEVVWMLTYCPNLINFGCSGNPCCQRGYRQTIIKHLPQLIRPDSKLIAIDDICLSPTEIKESKSERTQMDYTQFCFDLALHRNKTTEEVLDLSSAQLSGKLDFNNYPKLKMLNLHDNKLQTSDIIDSCLEVCHDIEYLDLSMNRISDNRIYNYIGSLSSLKCLNIEDNPVCPKKNDWRQFLQNYEKIGDVRNKLSMINGHIITIDDRVEIIKEQTGNEEIAESFRTEFLLFSTCEVWPTMKQFFMTNLKISSISIIQCATQLTTLNVANNRIRHLKGQGLGKLTNLRVLDIHDNEIESIDEIRDECSLLPNLERMFMHFSTRSKTETQDPYSYVDYMCAYLRGISEIDKFGNPRPLISKDLNAIKDIQQITQWYNPNHIHNIDLSNKNIDSEKFIQLLPALAVLSPRQITFKGNPCTDMDKYRYLLIYNIPDVQQIDGNAVTIDQRMNADKNIRQAKGTAAIENIVIGGALVAAEYVDQDSRATVVSSFKTATEYAVKYGTMMMKWEIFIGFQQVLSLIISLIGSINWPAIFQKLWWITWIFTIDLHFLSYLLDIKLPSWYQYISFFFYLLIPAVIFTLYHFQPDREYWHSIFTVDYCTFRTMMFWLFILLEIWSLGMALVMDFNYTIVTHKINNNQLAWFTVFSVISIAICIFLGCLGRHYHKNRDSPIIWFKAMKFKKRFALFILTVLYFPVCKSFVNTFTCVDGHSTAFTGLVCFESINNITIVTIASFIFGLLYSIGIPIFFVQLIRKGVHEIDLNYRIDVRLKQLEEKKKEVKRLRKEGHDVELETLQLKKSALEIDKCYAQAALEYENAAAYLYNAYKRKDRFSKVTSMIEKLVYLLITSFVPSSFFKAIISTVVMAFMAGLNFILMPFVAMSENVTEISSKTSNLITMLVGDSITFGWLDNKPGINTLVGILLIIVVLIAIIIALYYIFKNHCTCCNCCCCKEQTLDDINQSIYEITGQEFVEEEEEEESSEDQRRRRRRKDKKKKSIIMDEKQKEDREGERQCVSIELPDDDNTMDTRNTKSDILSVLSNLNIGKRTRRRGIRINGLSSYSALNSELESQQHKMRSRTERDYESINEDYSELSSSSSNSAPKSNPRMRAIKKSRISNALD